MGQAISEPGQSVLGACTFFLCDASTLENEATVARMAMATAKRMVQARVGGRKGGTGRRRGAAGRPDEAVGAV